MVNWGMVTAIALPNVGAIASCVCTIPRNWLEWYETLKKPSWQPPKAVFGPTWTFLYSSMGYASYLIYRDGGGFEGPARIPLMLYSSQLALNWSWSTIFFGMHRLGSSLVDIVALYGNVVLCAISFWEINQTASLIMLPYIGWLTVATALNYSIWRDNKNKPQVPGEPETGSEDTKTKED